MSVSNFIKADSSRKSGAGLIENIVRFSFLLRDNGIAVSLTAVIDAIAGLPLIDISRLDAFHCLLRINLISCKEDLSKFDTLFYDYWLPKERTTLKIPAEGIGEQEEEQDIDHDQSGNGGNQKRLTRIEENGRGVDKDVRYRDNADHADDEQVLQLAHQA